jgi:transposase
MSCKLGPMIRAAKMVEKHLNGIINAIVLMATNALGESMNAKIQKIKSQACGYRNRQRFRDAIMFRLGGLDLYPRTASTHTDS